MDRCAKCFRKIPALSSFLEILKIIIVKILDKAKVMLFRIKYYCKKCDPDYESKICIMFWL